MNDQRLRFDQAFLRHAAHTPAAVAVEFDGRQVTYGELAERSRRVAAALRAAGVGANTIVGVSLDRSVDLVVAILGVLRAGAAWLPLDPSYPAERLAYMLADSGVGLLLADDTAAATLPSTDLPRINPAGYDAEARVPATDGDDPPEDLHGDDDLAYMIYTSGSTGRPKGVLLTNGGLANLAAAQVHAFGSDPERRVLQFAPQSFDASVFELVMALHVGGTLVLAPRPAIAPGIDLWNTLRDKRISHVTLPPSVLATLPTAGQPTAGQPDAELPDLRVLICAGEALPEALAQRWAPGRRMFNAYGPTETTVWATLAEIDSADDHSSIGRPSIGTAIDGAHVAVVDERLRPVPAGEPGELVIGGLGVARGYHDRPALTAERFVPDPDAPGRRRYRTGDRVRQRPDGRLDFLGRIDHQIKLRGFRIEPDEVAAVLREHPGVTDAVVVARGEGTDGRLVGYVVAASTPAQELRAFLAARLPAYMVPAALVAVDALPLTPSGKVDRDALPEPDRESAGHSPERVAPRTATERTLAAMVGDLLGAGDVGVDDDFFALGGHSLLAGRLAAQVRAELATELPVATIYRSPTVAGMAAALDSAPDPTADAPAPLAPPPLTHADRTASIPLSLPQERIWFLEKLAPGNLAYNAQATIRLRGRLDRRTLRDTLAEIVRRHEVFRTGFVDTDAGPVQRPVADVSVRLGLVDLTGLPADKREARAETVVADALRAPFDLARPPLVRWTLIRHADDDHTLVHVEHHMVHDGWSFAVFLDELAAIYEATVAGRPHGLPEPAYQYADFAAWQRDWLRGEVLRSHLDHWTAELAGGPQALNLPTDRPRPPVQTFAGAALRVDLPADLCRALREYSRRRGVTLYTTMLSAFACLLRRYTGQDDLVIGSGVANRRLAEVERMIGMVVNTLPLRVDVSGRPCFDDLVRRVHAGAARAYEWSDTPFDALVEALAPVRDPSRNPVFQAMFNFHDSAVPDLDFAGLTGTVLERHNGSAKTDLNVVVIPRAEQRAGRAPRDDAAPITLIWEYATDLFDTETMRRMVGHFRTLLAAATRQPDVDVARLPLMSADETRQVVEECNRTAAPYPAGRTIPDLFAERVAADPEAVAVVGEGTALTYADLDERSDRLARLLRERGVRADTPVAVLLERGTEMITVFLAVLKAGGCYVPLDPAYPRERLAWMLSDVHAPVVVTRSGLRDRLPDGTVAEVLALDDADLSASGTPLDLSAPGVPLPRVTGPTGLAYILYTSGSTGRPKGVMVDHRAVLRLVCGTDFVSFGSGGRLAQVADASFDALTYEVWGALLHGGAVCVIPTDAILTPGRLGEELRKHDITGMFLTSALFNEVMAEFPDSFAGLDHLLVGGDVLNPGRIRQLLRGASAPRRLLNGYGPTETTTFAVAHHIDHLPTDATSVPIGRPIANTTVYVLDERLRPVPYGVPGELYIGGPGVARGYADRPALTAERFVPDPFGHGTRLYRTGDVVRWRPGPVLDFVGRVDNQVKIRGFRIEPDEAEAVLATHPAVATAAVVVDSTAVDGAGTDKRLVAYVVPAAPDAPPSVTQLRAFLGERLPPYLVPGVYMTLPALPLTPHGKLDRAALPRPDTDRPGLTSGFTPPRTATETVVAGLCADLLGLRRVGVDDDFFALGGHSLLAMRLVSRVNRACGVDVPLRRFLRAPTVAVLATAVDTAVDTAGGAGGGRGAGDITPGAWRRDERLLERIDQLTDAQVERLLSEMTDSETTHSTTSDSQTLDSEAER